MEERDFAELIAAFFKDKEAKKDEEPDERREAETDSKSPDDRGKTIIEKLADMVEEPSREAGSIENDLIRGKSPEEAMDFEQPPDVGFERGAAADQAEEEEQMEEDEAAEEEELEEDRGIEEQELEDETAEKPKEPVREESLGRLIGKAELDKLIGDIKREAEFEEEQEWEEEEEIEPKEASSLVELKEMIEHLAALPGVKTAVLLTADGFPIESAGEPDLDQEMVGAVVSSSITAVLNMGSELGQGQLTGSLLEYKEGVISALSITSETVLVIVAAKDVTVGRLRWEVSRVAPKIARVLQDNEMA